MKYIFIFKNDLNSRKISLLWLHKLFLEFFVTTLQLIFSTFPIFAKLAILKDRNWVVGLITILPTEDIGFQFGDEWFSAEAFWILVLKLKSPTWLLFPNVAVVITFLFSLLYSNVIAERGFNFLKTNQMDHSCSVDSGHDESWKRCHCSPCIPS